MVTTLIHPVVLPVENPQHDWQGFDVMCAPTATFAEMSSHASVLKPGHVPHPPDWHVEEEVIIPLYGQPEVVIANALDDPDPRIERVERGSIVYYPGGQHHTIRAAGSTAAAYLIFKWRARATQHSTGVPRVPTSIWRNVDKEAVDPSTPIHMRRLFEGPTTFLGKLHAHVTTLQPGAGYEPHVDAYDVAIFTLSGTVETLGERVGPDTVIYYAAGEPHGMRNVGSGVARYLVFEFHAPGLVAITGRSYYRRQAGRVLRAGKRLARAVLRRVSGG